MHNERFHSIWFRRVGMINGQAVDVHESWVTDAHGESRAFYVIIDESSEHYLKVFDVSQNNNRVSGTCYSCRNPFLTPFTNCPTCPKCPQLNIPANEDDTRSVLAEVKMLQEKFKVMQEKAQLFAGRHNNSPHAVELMLQHLLHTQNWEEYGCDISPLVVDDIVFYVVCSPVGCHSIYWGVKDGLFYELSFSCMDYCRIAPDDSSEESACEAAEEPWEGSQKTESRCITCEHRLNCLYDEIDPTTWEVLL